jgi:predicted acyltransferase
MTMPPPPLANRLYSLDALRGFDMFWIMGAEDIVHSLAKVTGSSTLEAIANQLTHPSWHGFHFYDLIFPLFLFMAGVATPYSLGKELEKGKTKQQLIYKVVKRGLILVILGIIHNNGLELRPVAEIRFGSVLGKIGLAYMFANFIYLYTEKRGRIIWFCCLLIGYWALFLLGAAPGFQAGDLTMQGNIVSYWDRVLMPGKLYLGIHDPEGIVAIIPAIGTALLGIYAGDLLKNSPLTMPRKALYLCIAGIISLAISLVWNLVFPINKNLWTSSFVLHVGGWSLLLLSLFYYIIDVKGYKRWAFFFSIIGMNSILIYMSGDFIDWGYMTKSIFIWLGQLVGDPYSIVVMAVCYVMIKWAFLYFMYKKNVFLRV